jgi:ketosteroid isomerase-like protein
MSEENVELVRRAFEAFNRRDLATMLALADEEIVVESRLAAMEGGYHGHQGVRRWWEDALDVLPDYEVEVDEVRDFGDVTLARLRARGHGAGSAAPLEEDPRSRRARSFIEAGRGGSPVQIQSHGCRDRVGRTG